MLTRILITAFLTLGIFGFCRSGNDRPIIDKIDPVEQTIAKAYLDSCPQNSLLFTSGTFSTAMEYIQQVFKYRTDVMVINKQMLELPTYYTKMLEQLRTQGIVINLPDQLLHPQGQISYPINVDEKRITNLAGLDEHFSNDSLYIKKDSLKLKYFPGRDMGILESDFTFRFKKLENRPDLTRQHIAWRWKAQTVSRGELLSLMIISTAAQTRPIAFIKNGSQEPIMGMDRYTVQHGLIELLQPVVAVRLEGEQSQKLVIESTILLEFLMKIKENNAVKDSLPANFSNRVLRPTILNEARYTFKQADTARTLALLNVGMDALDLETFGISDEIYPMGELYLKLGEIKKGQFLMDVYLTHVIASLEKSFVSKKIAQRKAVNASTKQLKTVREIIQAHIAKYPERSDYWNKRIEKLKARRKTWSQNIDLD